MNEIEHLPLSSKSAGLWGCLGWRWFTKEILSLVSFMTPKAWLWQLKCQEPVTSYLSPTTRELQGVDRNSSPLNSPQPFSPTACLSYRLVLPRDWENRKSRTLTLNCGKPRLFPTSLGKFTNNLLVGQSLVTSLVDYSRALSNPTSPFFPQDKAFFVLLLSPWTSLPRFHSILASRPPKSPRFLRFYMLAFLFHSCKKE